jgi:hypothetical protein
MKRKLIAAAVLCIIAAAIGAYIYLNTEKVVSTCREDMDNDGDFEELCMTGKPGRRYGTSLVIKDGARVFEYDIKDLKPWKVQTADVDGDGKKEISIGVFKTARFHPVEAKRPFIYNWSEKEGIYPKWLGSRLSRPFEDYIFADIDSDGMDELVSIELLSDGRKIVNSYNWKGFGFEGTGESNAFDDVTSISRGEPDKRGNMTIDAEVIIEDRTERIVLICKNGELVNN